MTPTKNLSVFCDMTPNTLVEIYDLPVTVKAISSSETSVYLYGSTRIHVPECAALLKKKNV